MDRYRVKPGKRIDLSDWDPDGRETFDGKKAEGREELAELTRELAGLQELLYAEHQHKLLIVLQAMDTGGKDGTIRHVFQAMNAQGVRVAGFKRPTQEEQDRDFLWRIHRQVPGRGEIVIFNRSHYEDVLIVRVHELVPKRIWSKRYDHINAFEQMLADEGATILKFYLHISHEEQRQRLQARLDEPEKRWKFDPADIEERRMWPKYIEAYEEVLSRTSTDWAPWHIVPANRKWYRNLVVAQTIVETLKGLEMHYPKVRIDPAIMTIE